ncbi:hypothetical protein GXW84_21385 [Rhodococcus sp. IEGM 248]|nr:hypothetical protein [Rhodococcus sp. IEGM 248]
MSNEDWRRHFGSAFHRLDEAEKKFDPDHVLTPGYDVFEAGRTTASAAGERHQGEVTGSAGGGEHVPGHRTAGTTAFLVAEIECGVHGCEPVVEEGVVGAQQCSRRFSGLLETGHQPVLDHQSAVGEFVDDHAFTEVREGPDLTGGSHRCLPDEGPDCPADPLVVLRARPVTEDGGCVPRETALDVVVHGAGSQHGEQAGQCAGDSAVRGVARGAPVDAGGENGEHCQRGRGRHVIPVVRHGVEHDVGGVVESAGQSEREQRHSHRSLPWPGVRGERDENQDECEGRGTECRDGPPRVGLEVHDRAGEVVVPADIGGLALLDQEGVGQS